jgi:hypothetical protein
MAEIKTMIKGRFNLYSKPKTNPSNKALNPYIPSRIRLLLKWNIFARILVRITAANPHNPKKGDIKVTRIMIMANVLLSEKKI